MGVYIFREGSVYLNIRGEESVIQASLKGGKCNLLFILIVVYEENKKNWTSDMSFDNVDIDYKITGDAFHFCRENVFEFGYIITSCKSLFPVFFTNFIGEFSKRQTMRSLMCLQERQHF